MRQPETEKRMATLIPNQPWTRQDKLARLSPSRSLHNISNLGKAKRTPWEMSHISKLARPPKTFQRMQQTASLMTKPHALQLLQVGNSQSGSPFCVPVGTGMSQRLLLSPAFHRHQHPDEPP